jgi:hypothetical protein
MTRKRCCLCLVNLMDADSLDVRLEEAHAVIDWLESELDDFDKFVEAITGGKSRYELAPEEVEKLRQACEGVLS